MAVDGRTLVRLGGPTAAVIVVWAVVGWTMPNGDASDAEARIETAQAALASSAAQLAAAEAEGDDTELLTARLERYELAVPADADQAGLFRRFDALGEEYGVVLSSVQITEDESGSTDGAAMAFADPPAATDLSTTDDASTDAAVTDASTADDATASTMPPMPGTSDSAAGTPLTLRVLRISTDITGPYAQVLDFIDALRASPRLIVIDQLSIVPDSEDPSFVSVNLSLRAFTQPTPATTSMSDPMSDPTGADPMAGDPMAGTAPVAGGAG